MKNWTCKTEFPLKHSASASLAGNLPWDPTKDESIHHDTRIAWPAIELPKELQKYKSKTGQPFFLNHVTGRQRCKDACMRLGMGIGALLGVWFMSLCMDKRSLSLLGFTLDGAFFVDSIIGLAVGITIVSFMFGVELLAGWVVFLQFFEVFDPSENFWLCIFWDVVFHLNVAINEELPVRGWLLYNLAEAGAVYLDLSAIAAFLFAMVLESVLFVVMHLPSPGGTRPLSMLNIFVGGMAGGLNVLLTGGRLGFALGWHFGWNISMGNVFGRSTSGIPISATFVSVVPHPRKEQLHGGVFGPEGGVISPAAYFLGIILLALIYGLPDFGSQNLLVHDWPLLDALSDSAIARCHEFEGQDLAITAWSWAKLEVRNPQLMGALCGSILAAIEDLGPQNVANTLWAWAAIRYREAPALSSMAALAVRRVGEFISQELANCVWAFAKLHFRDEALLKAASVEAIRRMEESSEDFDAMCVASISWAFATLGYWDGKLLEVIGAAVEKRVWRCKTQELSNLAWAFATLTVRNQTSVLNVIAAAACQRINEFELQHITNTT
ncbi:unnamed protein product [Cladocopium goreaui]|uniref:CPBP family intramembrane metalloprotease n=1 Tax=Cladocopium goreaui TaxID=2562237 RepID=A0A9P1CQT8_9DINO|nr:unnamed protein product [Cladocopium goreaui]